MKHSHLYVRTCLRTWISPTRIVDFIIFDSIFFLMWYNVPDYAITAYNLVRTTRRTTEFVISTLKTSTIKKCCPQLAFKQLWNLIRGWSLLWASGVYLRAAAEYAEVIRPQAFVTSDAIVPPWGCERRTCIAIIVQVYDNHGSVIIYKRCITRPWVCISIIKMALRCCNA